MAKFLTYPSVETMKQTARRVLMLALVSVIAAGQQSTTSVQQQPPTTQLPQALQQAGKEQATTQPTTLIQPGALQQVWCVPTQTGECVPLPPTYAMPQVITGKTGTTDVEADDDASRMRGRTVVESDRELAESEPDTDFQTFVSTATGQRVPIFGHRLFRRVPSTFAPVSSIPVTADYVIGPGDELLIRAWGQLDINLRAAVDRNGRIYIPKVGEVNVAGLKYEQIQPYLKTAIGRVFRNFDLNVNIGQLRSIQVLVVGQARRPGTYTVSALSTLVSTVFASGGPTLRGSLRRIQLLRDNKLLIEFDMYDLLLRGDKSKDARLLPGDVIFYPPAGGMVAMVGSVNTPAIYEVRGETTLEDAINLSGGMSTTASTHYKVIVERIEGRQSRRIEYLPTDKDGLQNKVRDGDVVRLASISPRFDNAVTLRGNVAMPGRYPYFDGMRVRDLIPTREALITREYWNNQNLMGNLAETPVKLAENGNRLDHTAIRNDVRRSAPEVNWDYALIQRLDQNDLSTRLIAFSLRKAVLEEDAEQNLPLQPGDVITVFSQADLTVPVEAQTKFVKVEGEVRAAGVYRVEPGETLPQLIARAGGLTANAYLFGAEFTRESTRQEQRQRFKRFIDELELEIERGASAASSVRDPLDAATLRERLEGQRKLVGKLRGTEPTGKIVLEVPPSDGSAAALPPIVLEDGDRIVVPYKPSAVNVLGAVYNENAFIWKSNKRLKDYLRQAGGPKRNADMSQLFVIRADGSVVSRNYGGLFSGGLDRLKLMPGDSIVVPEHLNKVGVMKNLKDWTQIISQFGLGAAAIRVLARD